MGISVILHRVSFHHRQNGSTAQAVNPLAGVKTASPTKAQLLRPLILSAASKQPLRRCINRVFHSAPTHILTGSFTHRRIFTTTTLLHRRNLHVSRARGLRPADAPVTSDLSQSDSESDSSDGERKSRNEKKREARRAVRWGMELAEFNDIQIKRILRVVELEEEVFSALMLVKRLGHDVREGKRRQFSYIGVT